jgi:GNAT superfamily N-acetyltransferase
MLRPATADDIEPLARLWHEGWHDGHAGHVPQEAHAHRRLDDLRQKVPPRLPHTTVAAVVDELLGFTTVLGDEVEQLYVVPAARGTGVAAALLDHAEGLVARTHDRAWLAVVAGNARARRFYERRGWAHVGAIANAADDTFIPALRYEKVVR